MITRFASAAVILAAILNSALLAQQQRSGAPPNDGQPRPRLTREQSRGLLFAPPRSDTFPQDPEPAMLRALEKYADPAIREDAMRLIKSPGMAAVDLHLGNFWKIIIRFGNEEDLDYIRDVLAGEQAPPPPNAARGRRGAPEPGVVGTGNVQSMLLAIGGMASRDVQGAKELLRSLCRQDYWIMEGGRLLPSQGRGVGNGVNEPRLPENQVAQWLIGPVSRSQDDEARQLLEAWIGELSQHDNPVVVSNAQRYRTVLQNRWNNVKAQGESEPQVTPALLARLEELSREWWPQYAPEPARE